MMSRGLRDATREGTLHTIWYDIIILDEIVFLRFLRKNVRLLLDFKIRFLRIKCKTSLGFELDRLYNKLVSS